LEGVVSKITTTIESCLTCRDDSLKIKSFLEKMVSDNTRRAYRGDIKYFLLWARLTLKCNVHLPIPKSLVGIFIKNHLKELDEINNEELIRARVKGKKGVHSINTISRRIATLSALHKSLNLPNPCDEKEISRLLSRARKDAVQRGNLPKKRQVISWDVLRSMLATCGDSLIDIRDRAILLFGFTFGNYPGVNVANVLLNDFIEINDGYIFTIHHKKMDSFYRNN